MATYSPGPLQGGLQAAPTPPHPFLSFSVSASPPLSSLVQEPFPVLWCCSGQVTPCPLLLACLSPGLLPPGLKHLCPAGLLLSSATPPPADILPTPHNPVQPRFPQTPLL